MRTTSAEIAAGRIAPKRIENGVTVPPSLQANAETLAEHQARLAREGRRPLTRAEAFALFPPGEAAAWFGRGAAP